MPQMQQNLPSELAQLKAMTTVVADTGDIDTIARLKPTEATTNPSLILKAAASGRYDRLYGARNGVERRRRERKRPLCYE